MCSIIEKKIIHNANRIVVCGLSSTPMLMDGLQPMDIPCFLALAIWLTLEECSSAMEKVVDKTRETLH